MDIRSQLVVGQRVEVDHASGWQAGIIVKVIRQGRQFPKTLVKYDNGDEWWTGPRSIRIAK